jgi:LEA14-like dessication related protein
MLRGRIHFLLLFALAGFFSCRAPEMITVSKVENARLLKCDQTGIEMEVSLRIKNPNHIGFNIYRSSNLDAQLNGMSIGKLKINKRIHIGANSDDAHTFIISSDLSKMTLSDIPKILVISKMKSANLNIKGELKVGKFFYKKTFQVDRTEKVSF